MSLPKISLIMRSEAGTRQEEIVAGAGTSIEVALDDNNGVGIGVDYTKADALRLRLDGKIKLKLLGHGAGVQGTIIRDLDTGDMEFNGTLEVEIDKDVAASMTTSFGPRENIVNGALKITF